MTLHFIGEFEGGGYLGDSSRAHRGCNKKFALAREGGGYLGDPGRAHRSFNKKSNLIGFYIFLHQLPAPG